FHLGGRSASDIVRPDFDLAILVIALIEPSDGAADAAGASAGGPDDVVVDRIGHSKAALATSDGVPGAPGNAVAEEAAELEAVARTAPGGAILAIAVDEVGNLVVDGDVIHLRNRQVHVVPGAAAVNRNVDPTVVHDRHAVAVCGIDPHFVIVA